MIAWASERPRTLFKKDDVFGLEPKVRVGLEIRLSFPPRRPAGHDIPWHDGRAGGVTRLLLRDLLQACDAFRLILEQGFVRWETDIVAAFRGRATQTSALSTSHEEHADLAPGDGSVARRPPFRLLLRARRDLVACALRQRLDRRFCSRNVLLRRDGLLVYAIDALDVERF